MRKKYVSGLFGALVLFFLASPALALEQNERLWIGINAVQNYGVDNPWKTYLFSQLRFINHRNDNWQSMFIEGAVGYQVNTENTFWFGYRWAGLNPYNDFSQENRFLQQYIFRKQYSVLYTFTNRLRLEEITLTTTSQIAARVRERLAVEIKHALFQQAFPYLYDEVFFQLNHPTYMPHTFLGENRLFLGVNLYRSERAWWEIGYINQYRIRSPEQTQNDLSHIISVTYNFS